MKNDLLEIYCGLYIKLNSISWLIMSPLKIRMSTQSQCANLTELSQIREKLCDLRWNYQLLLTPALLFDTVIIIIQI